jgi:DNA-3-methyladenine glycosylase
MNTAIDMGNNRVFVLRPLFLKQGTLKVAKGLLGKYLVRRIKGKDMAVIITDVEAYDGPHDRASHASRGMTNRNSPMFGEAGHWYVYLCYGIHNMLNIVAGPQGYPAAILIRGVREEGKREEIKKEINGPGRVTRYLGVTRKLNAQSSSLTTGLWIEDRGFKIQKNKIKRGPRIGVSYAGPKWSKKKYRFFLT